MTLGQYLDTPSGDKLSLFEVWTFNVSPKDRFLLATNFALFFPVTLNLQKNDQSSRPGHIYKSHTLFISNCSFIFHYKIWPRQEYAFFKIMTFNSKNRLVKKERPMYHYKKGIDWINYFFIRLRWTCLYDLS